MVSLQIRFPLEYSSRSSGTFSWEQGQEAEKEKKTGLGGGGGVWRVPRGVYNGGAEFLGKKLVNIANS
jgi:hypothetical protein